MISVVFADQARFFLSFHHLTFKQLVLGRVRDRFDLQAAVRFKLGGTFICNKNQFQISVFLNHFCKQITDGLRVLARKREWLACYHKQHLLLVYFFYQIIRFGEFTIEFF